MNTKRYDVILPQTRISQKVYDRLVNISETQELKMADVVRAALDEYIEPHPKAVEVPIVGKIVPHNGEFIIVPLSLLGGNGAADQAKSPFPDAVETTEVDECPF